MHLVLPKICCFVYCVVDWLHWCTSIFQVNRENFMALSCRLHFVWCDFAPIDLPIITHTTHQKQPRLSLWLLEILNSITSVLCVCHWNATVIGVKPDHKSQWLYKCLVEFIVLFKCIFSIDFDRKWTIMKYMRKKCVYKYQDSCSKERRNSHLMHITLEIFWCLLNKKKWDRIVFNFRIHLIVKGPNRIPKIGREDTVIETIVCFLISLWFCDIFLLFIRWL